MAKEYLPIEVANVVETRVQWEDIGRSPQLLAQWLCRMLGVNIESVKSLNEIAFQEDQPDDRSRLWIQAGPPACINVPSPSGKYTKIFEYPVNVPFIWTKGSGSFPPWLERIGTSDLTAMSLTPPVNSDYFYAILRQ